ncbi:MAG: flagellar basal body P-ring protein FlgI [Alphaproteobacteria bacterium]
MSHTITDRRHHENRGTIRRLAAIVLALLLVTFDGSPGWTASRIKDIADFEGIRENVLIGYGLVVGLKGTGDRLANAPFTQQSLVAMLERLGVNTRDTNVNTRNVAAVMVTATLPSFSRQGSRIDVTVSALGDASDLLGGTLLVTPLMGADGEIYAVSQGQVAVGGFNVSGDSASVSKGVSTSGRIPSGAIIEREINFDLASLDMVRIALRNPDLTTARRIAQAINAYLGSASAVLADPSTVDVAVPSSYRGHVASLLADIEQLSVEPDQLARVVVDEQSGIIVMGENVRISTVAIAQGNLTVRITETPQVSQPPAFAPDSAQTVVVPRTTIEITEDPGKRLAVVSNGISLDQLIEGLNALGINPRDLISILQAIKAAGALHAELEIM